MERGPISSESSDAVCPRLSALPKNASTDTAYHRSLLQIGFINSSFGFVEIKVFAAIKRFEALESSGAVPHLQNSLKNGS